MARIADIASIARRGFGAALFLVGIVHAIFGEAPQRLFPLWPQWLPGRPWWAHAAGALLAVFGAQLLLGRRARQGAEGIALVVLASVLLLHLPRAIASGALGNAWLSVIKFSALAGGAALVASSASSDVASRWRDAAVARGAVAERWLMGAFMIYSAYLHFRYTQSVSRLLPPWMPWPMFWVRFAGAALGIGGAALWAAPFTRLAARLTAVMIVGFFLLVHIPRTLADPLGHTGWLELGESAAYVMIALLLSFPDPPAPGAGARSTRD